MTMNSSDADPRSSTAVPEVAQSSVSTTAWPDTSRAPAGPIGPSTGSVVRTVTVTRRIAHPLPRAHADVSGIVRADRRADQVDRASDPVGRRVVGERPEPGALRRRIQDRVPDVERERELQHRERQEGQHHADEHELDDGRAAIVADHGLEPRDLRDRVLEDAAERRPGEPPDHDHERGGHEGDQHPAGTSPRSSRAARARTGQASGRTQRHAGIPVVEISGDSTSLSMTSPQGTASALRRRLAQCSPTGSSSGD